jgi:hypothetical protein
MAKNLLTICTRALDRIGSFNVPTSLVGNEDDTAKQLLAIAKDVGEELCRDYTWTDNSRTATVSTVADEEFYDLEADYDRIVSDTLWKADSARQNMRGSASRMSWAAITNLQTAPDGYYRWRVYRRQIQIFPVPSSVFDFSYEYLSNVYCTDLNGVERTDGWLADTDLPILPDDLFVHGVRYYFRKENNMPYGAAEAEFEAVLAKRLASEDPGELVCMSDAVVPLSQSGYGNRLNIPEIVDLT